MGEFLDGYLEREHKRLEAVSLSSLFHFLVYFFGFLVLETKGKDPPASAPNR